MSSMGLCGAVIVMCCNDKTHEIRLSLLEAKIADRGASNESRVVVVVVDVALLILLLLLIIPANLHLACKLVLGLVCCYLAPCSSIPCSSLISVN